MASQEICHEASLAHPLAVRIEKLNANNKQHQFTVPCSAIVTPHQNVSSVSFDIYPDNANCVLQGLQDNMGIVLKSPFT